MQLVQDQFGEGDMFGDDDVRADTSILGRVSSCVPVASSVFCAALRRRTD